MTPESMNDVFLALAHPVRRKVLDIVKDSPGCSVNEVCDYFEISRIAVMKHLRVLERADLIVSRKQGRTRELYFNAIPIQLIHDRWTTVYSALWASGLTRVKYRIESMQPRGKKGGGSPEPRGDKTRDPFFEQRKRHA
jgi:DNA-binding transcriptional ArsR family regulator